MIVLISKLLITTLILILAIKELRAVSNKVKLSLKHLDDMRLGELGYFAASQRYYDYRKILVMVYTFAVVCSALVFSYLADIAALLNT